MSILPGESNSDETRHPGLKQSIENLKWVVDTFHGLVIPSLPTSKRAQLAGGCFHVAIEHGQAIVVLVDERLYGSALAMQRPLFEAYLRGMWLLHAATDAEVDAAGRDDFPRNINKILDGVTQTGVPHLAGIKSIWWDRLCSLTHTGFRQIGARLTSTGLAQNYREEEIAQALGWADGIGLQTVAALSLLAGDEARARLAQERMRSIAGSVPPDASIR
jgi:hypothetical protein